MFLSHNSGDSTMSPGLTNQCRLHLLHDYTQGTDLLFQSLFSQIKAIKGQSKDKKDKVDVYFWKLQSSKQAFNQPGVLW